MLAPGLLPGLSRGPHEAEVNTTPPQLDSREFRNRPLSFLGGGVEFRNIFESCNFFSNFGID